MDNTHPLERPSNVTTAVHLLYISLVFPGTLNVLECFAAGGNKIAGIVGLGLLPIMALLFFAISKGKNWARITCLVICVAGFVAVIAQHIREPPALGALEFGRVSLFFAETGCELAALILLFQPDASLWFRQVSGPRNLHIKGILQALRNTEQPAYNYIWKAWLISFVPSMVISFIVQLTMPAQMPPLDAKAPVALTVLGILVISPWSETLLMWPVLWILERTVGKMLWVAAISAVLWALVHSLLAPAWGFGVAWPFFVFSMSFLEWKKKSLGRAIGVTASIHMCQNLVPSAFFVLASLAKG